MIALEPEYLQSASETELLECHHHLEFILTVLREFEHARRNPSSSASKPTRTARA
jgi:hypothetical protein